MKSWDGDLGHLNQEEMAIFRHFYQGFKYEYRYSFDTKADVRRTVAHFKKCDWPKKVIDICEFMMYDAQEQNRKETEKYERKLYNRLKRKYG